MEKSREAPAVRVSPECLLVFLILFLNTIVRVIPGESRGITLPSLRNEDKNSMFVGDAKFGTFYLTAEASYTHAGMSTLATGR